MQENVLDAMVYYSLMSVFAEKLWRPEFIGRLYDKEELEGGHVTFSCRLNAKPPPTITWSV